MKIESIKYQHISRGFYNVLVHGQNVGTIIKSKNDWYLTVDSVGIEIGKTRGGTVQAAIDNGWVPKYDEARMCVNIVGHGAYYSCDSCGIELNGDEVGHVAAGYNYANGEFCPCPECSTLNSIDRDNEDDEDTDNLVLDTLLEDIDSGTQIKPECIERINPDAVEFWIDNCMSKSLQGQLDTIITDYPALFGEIVEYCIEDTTQYYRYLATRLADLSCLSDSIVSHIMSRFETEKITHDNCLSSAVSEIGQNAKEDMSKYYAANALYMAVTRSTNASYYAMQAGIKKADIINNVLSMLY